MQKEVKPFLSRGGIDDSLSLPCPDEEKIKLLYVFASPWAQCSAPRNGVEEVLVAIQMRALSRARTMCVPCSLGAFSLDLPFSLNASSKKIPWTPPSCSLYTVTGWQTEGPHSCPKCWVAGWLVLTATGLNPRTNPHCDGGVEALKGWQG